MESTDPLIGQKINNYTIVSRLGQGGMGIVYKALHETLGRHVAIKFLATQLASNEEFVERFLREARAAAQLNHPNLIGVHDAGQIENTYFIVMEFVEGRDLAALLREQRLFTETETVYFGQKIAEALGYAHQHGIIHRDVKPENVILTTEGEIKVADLGLAKQADESASSMTMSGVVMGTPYYISPEQIRGAKDVDIRTDIYSLGATLFHLSTGYIPFKGGSSAEIMSKHLTLPLPPPQGLNPDLSDGFSKIITKMLAKDPSERPQTMDEVFIDLGTISQNSSLSPTQAQAVSSETVIFNVSPSPTPTPSQRVLRVPKLPTPTHSPSLPAPILPSPPPSQEVKPVPSTEKSTPHRLRLAHPQHPSENPIAYPQAKSKLLLWMIALMTLTTTIILIFPKIKTTISNLPEAKSDSSLKPVSVKSEKLGNSENLHSYLTRIIEQQLRKQEFLSNLPSNQITLSETLTLVLDATGNILSLSSHPADSEPALQSPIRHVFVKAVQSSAPFAHPQFQEKQGWKGKLKICYNCQSNTIRRPLLSSEKSRKNDLENRIQEKNQQIQLIENQLQQLRTHLIPPDRPASPLPPPGRNENKLAGNFKGSLSQKFDDPSESNFKRERDTQIQKLESETVELRSHLQKLFIQLAPLKDGFVVESSFQKDIQVIVISEESNSSTN